MPMKKYRNSVVLQEVIYKSYALKSMNLLQIKI